MNVLFDNCASPVIASTLHGYIKHYECAAFHLKDVPGLPKGRHSADVDWIDHLRKAPEKWIFISGDARILKNSVERAALRSAGLHGFILAPAYQKTALNQVAAIIVWRWPEILKITELLAAPSMHEIPIGRMTKLKQLPV